MKANQKKHKDTLIDAYYQFGYEKFGPFLYGFMYWLREELKKEKYDKVFFMSRDGYMMDKANNVLQNNEFLNIDFEYVYFSRNSLRRALLWTATSYKESLKYMGYSKYVSFSEIMDYYGFTKETALQIAEKYRIIGDEYFLYKHLAENERIKTIYDDYTEIIQKESEIQYQMVIAYMNQLNISGNIAIVDIGWNGTIQWCLEEIIYTMKKDTTVSGYYVGINPFDTLKGQTHGYMYDNSVSKTRKELLCFFGVIETFFQSDDGTTIGYVDAGKGQVAPVNERNEYADDLKAQEDIKNIQKGAIQYIKDKSKVKSDAGIIQDYVKPFIRFGKYPSLKETKMFSFLFIRDGQKSYFLPQKPIFRYKPNEFLYALSNSCWKTGFMKAAFKIPLPYFNLYEILRK